MARSKNGAQGKGRKGLFALLSAWAFLIVLLASGFAWVFYFHPDAQTEGPETAQSAEDAPSQEQAPSGEALPGGGEGTTVTAQLPNPDSQAEAPQAVTDTEPAAEQAELAVDPITTVTAEIPPETTAETPRPAKPAGSEATAEQLSDKLQKPEPSETRPTWQRYAKAFDVGDTRPRVAVVVTGLGLSAEATQKAVSLLDPAFTLSFSPYAPDLSRWIAQARVQGHEVMLDLPMEPVDFPLKDPGPLALMTNAGPKQNLARLNEILGRGSSYVGVAAKLGSRFASSESDMKTLLRALKTKGLVYLDNGRAEESRSTELAASLEVALLKNDRFLDNSQANAEGIRARLAQVEQIALTRGQALAMAGPYPLAIEQLADWAKGLEDRGLVLAPATALLKKPDPA